ncbi:MAG: hypothetical protein ABSE73_06105 [Planctomycetota bacterium]
MLVSGRTSTLKSIVTKKVGQNIPKIFGGQHSCKNTPGFDWYVSQHYALKANVGDKLAEHFLILAELAYPHYVEVIGCEPYGIETTRMAFTHATTLELMQKGVFSDINDYWVGGGGGVTLPASFAAYNYPSGGLSYHRNDISLHENLHLLQLVSQGNFNTPLVFTEGITHFFANHVYDPEKRQLTVAVFDKAPINNPVDAGLRLMREKGVLSLEELIRGETPKEYYASAHTLFTAFFWTNPERLMKWRIWRDEIFSSRVAGPARTLMYVEVLRSLCGGSLDKLNAEWRAWLQERHNTFTHVDWGWEQWGETLQSYGWPHDTKYFSQMDLNCPPGKPLPPEPLRLDYPRAPRPPLVGAVQLGAAEPSVGCTIDFHRTPNQGWAGLGLSVDGRKLLRIAVDKNKALILDGTLLKLGAGRKDTAFPQELLEAAKKTNRLGLTVRIAKESLQVTVKSGTGDALKEMTASYPLTPTERADLLGRPMALLSRDGRHEITPYLEEPPASQPDLSKPAPPNRWRFAGDKEAYRLCRAVWRMAGTAPAALLDLRNKLVGAMDKDPAVQEEALAAYRTGFEKVIAALRKSDTAEARLALVELSGAALALRVDPDSPGKTTFLAVVKGAQDSKVAGTLAFSSTPEAAVEAPKTVEQFEVSPDSPAAVRWAPNVSPGHTGSFSVCAKAELAWRGAPLTLHATLAARPSVPCYWVIGPFDNKGDGTVDTPQPVESEAFGSARTYTGKGKKQIGWAKAERPVELGLEQEYVVDFLKLYGGENVSAYALVWVLAPKEMEAELAAGADDGLVAWLNDKRVLANLKNRGYQSCEDRVPVAFKAGANKLLLRVTQTNGDWKMCAHLQDKNGNPIPELKYSLEPGK